MNTRHFTFFRFSSHSPKTLIGIFLVQYPPRIVIPLNFSSLVPSRHILSSLAHPSFVSLLFWLSFFLTCLPLPVLSLHCRTSLRFSSFFTSHFHPYIRSITSSLFSHLRFPIYNYNLSFLRSIQTHYYYYFFLCSPKKITSHFCFSVPLLSAPLIFHLLSSFQNLTASYFSHIVRYPHFPPDTFSPLIGIHRLSSASFYPAHSSIWNPCSYPRLRFYIFPSLVLCCSRPRLPHVLAFSRPLLSLPASFLSRVTHLFRSKCSTSWNAAPHAELLHTQPASVNSCDRTLETAGKLMHSVLHFYGVTC